MNKQKVKKIIKEAFNTVAHPGKNNIALHNCEDCSQIREAFGGIKWKNVKRKRLEEYYDALPLFSPEAFHYFLPAFLIQSVKTPTSSFVGGYTILSLQSKDLDWYHLRMNQFSLDQIKAIICFLEYIPEHNQVYKKHIDSALTLWTNFLFTKTK